MLRVQLVGRMRVDLDGTVVEAPASQRAWAVLAWLALHPGRHPRGRLSATFWPDFLDSSARASLRSAIWALRRSLGPHADDYLYVDHTHLGLRREAPIWVDTRTVDALAAQGRTREAVDIGSGVLLADVDDEWVIEAREAHELKIAALLEVLADRAQHDGDMTAAVGWTRRQVALDPLAEEPVQKLMRRLATAGDRAAAMTAYGRFRAKLARELQLAPSPATRQLAGELRTRRPEVQREDPTTVQDWPLVGRERELARLRAAWKEAANGRSVVATVSGESGIGKSRLASELLDVASSEGALVAGATALDLGGTAPFGLWAELIGALAPSLDAPPLDSVWPGALSPLAPDLETQLGFPPVTPGRTSPELERTRLYEAIVGLLAWACRRRPIVLLLEDIHAADVTSLDVIGYVCRRLARAPMLVILTRRPLPQRVQVDALEQSLRGLHRLTTEITLGPLGAEHAARLVREVAVLPQDRVEQVVTAADGNALLAVEWAAALARGEDSPPASLRAAVRTAVITVHGEALELARFAAVAGRSLDREEIEALPFESPYDATRGAAECTLLTTAHGRVGYRHALLREAAYVDLPDPVRDRLHDRFGQMLAGRHPRVAGEAARHLRLAGRNDLAVEQFVRAAGHARTVAALPDAAAALTEALELAPDNPSLMVELAEVEAFRGQEPASARSFEQALGLLSTAEESAGAWVRRAAWYRGALCHPRNALDAARRAVDILDEAGLPAPDLRIEALAQWSWAEAVAGDVEIADQLLERVRAVLGKREASDALIPAIAHARAFALVRRGKFKESYPAEIAAAEASKRLGRPDLSYGAWANAACAATCAGEFERALNFIDRGLVEVSDSGLDSLEFHLLAARAHMLARLGRHDEARTAAGAQRTIAERLGSEQLLATADHDGGLLALREGQFAEAAAMIGAAIDHDAPVSRPLARLARAEALIWTGQYDEATTELRLAALEPVHPGDMPETLVPRLTWLQGLIARGRGDEPLALRRLQEAADGWQRVIGRTSAGEQYVAALADFGRPPVVGMVEPARELERVLADLHALDAAPA